MLEQTVLSAVIASMVPLLGMKPYWRGFMLLLRIGFILFDMTFKRIFMVCEVKAIVRCSSHFIVLFFLGSVMISLLAKS